MPTGQTIASRVLTTLGLLEQGGTASVSDSSMIMDQLNVMWDSWSIDEGLIYAVITERFPSHEGYEYYTIGQSLNCNWVAQPPSRIYSASLITASGGQITSSFVLDGGLNYAVNDTGIVNGSGGIPAVYQVVSVSASGVVTANSIINAGSGYQVGNGALTYPTSGVGSGLTINIGGATSTAFNRNRIEVVDATRFYSHRDMAASAATPDEIYPDYNPDSDGFFRVYVWPIINVDPPPVIELQMGVNFTTWQLSVNYNVPPGMADAINYALAFRLIPIFGMTVSQQVVATITPLAQKAELRMRESNKFNRKLPEGSEILQVPPEAKEGQ